MSQWTVPGYEDLRDLGRGASGRVVLARHDGTQTPVAIKYLADDLCADDHFLRRFRGEARLLAEISSPHVASLYEYVEADLSLNTGSDPATARAAIVMELVDGVTLRRMLREHGPLTPEAALAVLKGSLLGLAAAHTRGVVHRDYKPENVLVDTSGTSKLVDFGIAARAGRSGGAGVAGPGIGTPAYMAPEQWAGGPATPATDIYAASATFFECLTARVPFPYAGDLAALRRAHEQAPLPLGDVPRGTHDLLRRGLAKDPAARPADATAFVARLEAAAAAAYGGDWERRGRGSLARRVALLALLLPGAQAAVGASAVAVTALGSGTLGGGAEPAGAGSAGEGTAGGPDGMAPSGLSIRVFPWAAATAGVVVGGVILAACLGVAPLFASRAYVSSTATAGTEVTPEALAPPLPEPSQSSDSATPTTSVTAPPPAPPTQQPVINSVTVNSFGWVGDNAEAGIVVTTGNLVGFGLTVRFMGTYLDGTEIPGFTPIIQTYQLSGQTFYTLTATLSTITPFCDADRIKVTASTGGVTSAPATLEPPC